jgi:hypothetical protein
MDVLRLMPGVPPTENPLYPRCKHHLGWDDDTLRVGDALHAQGFAVIDFPDAEFEARAERIKQALAPQFDFTQWRAEGWSRNAGLRIQDAWRSNDDVKAIATNPTILRLLATLYGRRAFPFQTLNFPVGTQQHYHSDALHFSSVPERFVAGVWVALEDIHEDAGPLLYYPGSHTLPIYADEHVGVVSSGPSDTYAHGDRYVAMWEALTSGLDLRPQVFTARKGQALIWAANLLHGGHRQQNPMLTRWSQVTHYYFDDCAYYTPFLSDAFFGRIAFRDDITDISTGEVIANRYCGREIPPAFIATTSWLPPAKRFSRRVRRWLSALLERRVDRP